jgi:alpha-ketoglutarate-dependent 2,4-dichlorophenoxyacetate dioxygenase
MNDLKFTKLHQHIGVEVHGVDLRRELSSDVISRILAAFNQYSVMVFRNQKFNDEQQISFSKYFGKLEPTSIYTAATNRFVYQISNIDNRGKVLSLDAKKRNLLKINSRWHTDSSFKAVPALSSILSAREIPVNEKADTEFASMRVGYKRLSPAKRETLRGLMAVHDYNYSMSIVGDCGLPQEELNKLPPVRHPILRTHPGSGEPNLYLSGHIESIDGMPKEEGRRLVEELIEWCTQPEYIYSHKWQQDDVVIWDNRCVLHRVQIIPEREVRRVHRTTIAGEDVVEALN